uniref:U2-ctenitoxin-Pr1a n=1 Tax=Phoneutria reidyi TaxID=272752 RepID=TX21A_PHORI|nr:RecName: Full=U2-ctenitoxin-Pr1a; Short=U2-CNTX-Pr1a; AltName: Full=Neurotoxin PRTx22C1 [Phoneutria reidyi]
ECADVYKECWYPEKPCCKDRACQCSLGMNCKCKATLGDIF